MDDVQKIMGRVTALLAKADSTEFPEEASALRAKAQELMQKYRLEEADLIAKNPGALTPVWVDFDLLTSFSEYQNFYLSLVHEAAAHAEVRYAHHIDPYTSRVRVYACGFESDIRLFEWLVNSARLAFREKLEPDLDRSLSDEENIYRLRQAGVTRSRVAYLLWGSDAKDGVAHGKVGRIYKEQCRLRGEQPALDGRGMSLGGYREAYAREFVVRFGARLEEARDGSMVLGGALVLKGRAQAVEDAYYTRFPSLHPDARKAARERAVAQRGGKPAKTRSWTQADERRWRRSTEGAAARAGRVAGAAAADAIEIDRTPRTGRIEA